LVLALGAAILPQSFEGVPTSSGPASVQAFSFLWYNQMENMAISQDIFKEYDVRGIYPHEVNADTARLVGSATVRYLRGRTLVVGEDGRTSSPVLAQAVVEGIISSGCNVHYIGKCTTPLFYFVVHEMQADGGIMVTASHNPREYNGFKIVGRDTIPIGLGNGLEVIAELAEHEPANIAPSGNMISDTGSIERYVTFLIHEAGLRPGTISLPIIVDAGNGVAGLTMAPLLQKLRIPVIPMRFQIDGTFPARSPDPSLAGALTDLTDLVMRERAAMGFAFDGDADRLVVIDEWGKFVSAQYILALLWQSARSWWHAPKVVHDLRFSRIVRQAFGKHGIRSMAGHTNVSNMMRYQHADFGGETSGHFYFKSMQYMESSELAALELLRYVQKSKKPLSELVEPLLSPAYSGEITLPMAGMPQVLALIRALKEKYHDGTQDELDGLTIEYSGWWFNVRASHTEPVMRLVVEAVDVELMNEKIREIQTLAEYTN
jgi:phosphomannomutase